MENPLKPLVMCVCKHCGCQMTGYPGDNECSDCANGGVFGRARKAAAEGVEKAHFERTGETKTCGEILRGVIGM